MHLQQRVAGEGFAILPNVLSSTETKDISEQLMQHTFRRSRAGARHILSHPAIESLARDSRLLRCAQDVLGSNAFPFRATLFDKSATANWLVVWHQDTALPLRERREAAGWGPWSVKEGIHYAHAPASALSQVLALRIHLDESTAANGPLRVLPGTHNLGVLSDDAVHDLAAKIPPVDCLVPTGGLLAMRPLVIHASSKSQISLPRRVLHIEYAASLSIAAPLELASA